MLRSRSGFTLLELLIALGITALLVSAAVQAYISISNAQERARGGHNRDRSALVLLDRIERELEGAMLIVRSEEEDRLGHPYLFVGDDRVFGSGDSDAIRFVTLTPARPPGGEVSGGIRMVSYGVEPRANEGLDLLRQEEPLPEGMEKRILLDQAQVVMEQMASFRLRYQDEETGEWVELWDSTDISLLDRLPEAVEVTVQLYQTNENEELEPGLEHQRVARLRIRPFDREELLERRGEAVEEDQEDEEDEDEEDEDEELDDEE